MILRDGEKVTLDGVEFELTSAPPDGWWMKESGSGSYYHMMYKSTRDLERLYKDGRLRVGKLVRRESGKEDCAHYNWEKYVGITEVYRFCTRCGAKEHVDWRLIRDEKDY